mgnify:CR=1 FL=1
MDFHQFPVPRLDLGEIDRRFQFQLGKRLFFLAASSVRGTVVSGSFLRPSGAAVSGTAETLLALRRHLRETGRRGRIVVWAHNSHLGDARATEMGRQGEWNVGQLLREQAGEEACHLVGFTTATGHVTAADDWDEPALHRWVRPPRADSYEHLLHRTGVPAFWLPMQGKVAEALRPERLERAIGVIYRPRTERQSHYFRASMAAQFDSVIHVDETTAVVPFDISEHWEQREAPETWPSGL